MTAYKVNFLRGVWGLLKVRPKEGLVSLVPPLLGVYSFEIFLSVDGV